jgi:hypothetical protein
MARRSHSTRSIALQAAELAWAAPQVMTHRLLRLATAGPNPSLRDRGEFARMGWEKVGAFYESWTAMAFETLRQQQAWWLAMASATTWPWLFAHPGTAHSRRALHHIVGRGLAPVHRRALANARRLAKR